MTAMLYRIFPYLSIFQQHRMHLGPDDITGVEEILSGDTQIWRHESPSLLRMFGVSNISDRSPVYLLSTTNKTNTN